MNDSEKTEPNGRAGLLVGVAAVVISIIGGNVIVMNKLPPEKRSSQVLAPLVNVSRAEVDRTPLMIGGNGVVESQHRLMLTPEVSGTAVEVNPQLVAGGRIAKGDLIVRIDPRDYEAALEDAKAALAHAQFELELENGWQDVARREWELLGESVNADASNRDLALRVPHLKQKTAALKAAEARVARAELNLERTEMRAPYNVLVLQKSIALGQAIGPGQPVAELVGTDEFRVQVSLPVHVLSRIRIPGSPARVIQRLADGTEMARSGEVVALSATLDPRARMASVYVTVKKPMSDEENTLPLLLGSYVRVKIETEQTGELIRIDRQALHDLEQSWVIRDDLTLEPRRLDVVHRGETYVWVSDGIEDGELLLTSSMRSIVPGMKIRLVPGSEEAEPEEEPAP